MIYFEAKFNHTLTFITLQSDDPIFDHNEFLNISLAYDCVCVCVETVLLLLCYTKQNNPSPMVIILSNDSK